MCFYLIFEFQSVLLFKKKTILCSKKLVKSHFFACFYLNRAFIRDVLLFTILRYTGLWVGWWLGHMFQSWGCFFLCPWHYVCQFSAKNLIGHDLWNVSKKITTSIEVKIAIKTLRHSPARVQWDFLPRIGICNVKDIRKNVPNFEACDPTPTPPTTLYI